MRVLFRILITAGAVILIAQYVPGISIDSLYSAFIVALVWGVISVLVRPVLFILTLPITLLTFGLFSFVLNALLFWFVATFVDGFTVDGFLPALIGSLALSVVSWVTHRIL